MVSTLTVAAHSGANLSGSYSSVVSKVSVQCGWTDVGTLLDTPSHTLTALPGALTLAQRPAATAGVATKALVEDANGVGASVSATPSTTSSDVSIAADSTTPVPALQAPLRILWDLVNVTRGATVRDEQLGAATRRSRRAGLQPRQIARHLPHRPPAAPATAILHRDPDGRPAGTGPRCPRCYGHGPDETIFQTYEDDDGKTHVRTGDGETGGGCRPALPCPRPTGSAPAPPCRPPGRYRRCSTAVPNLASVRNPVPPDGGADPDRGRDPPARAAVGAHLRPGGLRRRLRGRRGRRPRASRARPRRGSWTRTSSGRWCACTSATTRRAVASARAALRGAGRPEPPAASSCPPSVPAALGLVLRSTPTYVARTGLRRGAHAPRSTGLFAPACSASASRSTAAGSRRRRRRAGRACGQHGLDALAVRDRLPTSPAGPRFDPGDGGFFTLGHVVPVVSEEAGR